MCNYHAFLYASVTAHLGWFPILASLPVGGHTCAGQVGFCTNLSSLQHVGALLDFHVLACVHDFCLGGASHGVSLGFDLHFPDGGWHRTFSHRRLGHLCLFLWEMKLPLSQGGGRQEAEQRKHGEPNSKWRSGPQRSTFPSQPSSASFSLLFTFAF